jgi:hypothetical protein
MDKEIEDMAERIVDAWDRYYVWRDIFTDKPAYCLLKLDNMIKAGMKRLLCKETK